MAGSLDQLPENRYHVRSISMPSRSHPLALRVEEETRKLRAWETSSKHSSFTKEKICIGLGYIRDLYGCIEELIHLPLTQQGLINHHHREKCVDEISIGLVRLMDVCGATRDILMTIKDYAQRLQFALRRRRGQESCIESKVRTYIHSRKKVIKNDISKCLGELKRMEISKSGSTPLTACNDLHLAKVVIVLGESRAITIAVLRAVLSFMAASRPNPKPSKWSLVSKLVHKGLVGCDQGEQAEDMNEMESVDVALNGLIMISGHIANKDTQIERAQMANKRLQALEIGIDGVEAGLECMFRRLIQIRVSLLNILSY